MSRALRTFWLLLVMAAVPLQGMAAVTMMACGPAHHAPAAGAARVAAGAQADGHAHAHAGAAAQAAPAGQADASEIDDLAGSTAAPSGPAATDGSSVAKCSVCASCCTATALPAQAVVSDPLALTQSLAAPEPVGAAAFLTEGTERPPRSILA